MSPIAERRRNQSLSMPVRQSIRTLRCLNDRYDAVDHVEQRETCRRERRHPREATPVDRPRRVADDLLRYQHPRNGLDAGRAHRIASALSYRRTHGPGTGDPADHSLLCVDAAEQPRAPRRLGSWSCLLCVDAWPARGWFSGRGVRVVPGVASVGAVLQTGMCAQVPHPAAARHRCNSGSTGAAGRMTYWSPRQPTPG